MNPYQAGLGRANAQVEGRHLFLIGHVDGVGAGAGRLSRKVAALLLSPSRQLVAGNGGRSRGSSGSISSSSSGHGVVGINAVRQRSIKL